MKKNIFLALVLPVIALFMLTGCVGALIKSVSPRVIGSDIDATVARNEYRKSVSETATKNEEITQEIAEEWKLVAIEEIKGKRSSDSSSTNNKRAVIDKEGVLGGFQCIFKNDTPRKKTLTFQKIGGIMNGYKFEIALEKRADKPYKLPAGRYIYWYTVENINYRYPENGPGRFEVTVAPHYTDSESGLTYHGGVRLYGY